MRKQHMKLSALLLAALIGFSTATSILVEATPTVVYAEETEEKTLIGITITALPDKLTYVSGEPLDLAGLEVTANYSDESATVLPPAAYDVTGYTTAVGEQMLTVTFGTRTATFTIAVAVATVYPTSIKTKNTQALVVGQSYQPEIEYTPSNTTETSLTWQSSNASIAEVSEDGTVTAKAVGTAIITATTVNGLTASIAVTVFPAVASVTINKSTTTLMAGKTEQLSATVLPNNAGNPTITWSSSDTGVATISSSGKVTAKKAGTATITASTSNGINATCKVTVKAAPTSVKLSASSKTLGVKETYTLTATIAPSGAWASGYSWKSSNTAVATVNSSGKVTAKKAGTATITYTTANGKKTTCKITVKKAPTSVKLSASSKTIYVGKSYTPKATLSSGSSGAVTWTSSNAKVATVSSSGKITAKGNGTATITVKTYNGKKATIKVTCITAATKVSFNQSTLNLGVGETYTVTKTVTPSTATYKATGWKSSNTKVATVNSSGKITAKKAGTATITYTTYNGKKASCKVTVKKAPTSVKLSATSATLDIGKTKTLTATKSSGSYGAVTWTSSNTKVATVSSSGKVTAIGSGSTTITVKTYNGKKATCKITVLPLASSVAIHVSTMSLMVNDSSTLLATISPSNASNKSVTWTSSDTGIATVSSTGRVTGKSAGTATITATTSNGKKATCIATITAPIEVDSVTLDKTLLELETTDTATLSTTISPSNAADKTISWTSSNTSIATVNSSGKVTAKSAGTATITATSSNGKNATCSVTVTPKKVPIKLSLEENLLFTDTTETVTVTPNTETITWTSSDTSVATVSSSGKVTAVWQGTNVGDTKTVTITATTAAGMTDSIALTLMYGAPFDYAPDQDTLRPLYNTEVTTQSEIKQLRTVITTFVKDNISSSMTDYEKVLTAYRYVIANTFVATSYVNEPSRLTTTLLKGEGNCSGYSRAMRALCYAFGVECESLAPSKQPSGSQHEWVVVKLDGIWYHIDAQADDKGATPGYGTFLVTDAAVNRGTSFDWTESRGPSCTTPYYDFADPSYSFADIQAAFVLEIAKLYPEANTGISAINATGLTVVTTMEDGMTRDTVSFSDNTNISATETAVWAAKNVLYSAIDYPTATKVYLSLENIGYEGRATYRLYFGN